jgi:deferrochelatase/peroxidase EfeB
VDSIAVKEVLMANAVDFSDVQGLVRFGFGKMTEAAYLLVKIRNVSAARRWLAQARPTTAMEMNPLPETAMQFAITSDGLKALGLSSRILAGFSDEFLEGMANVQNRSERLGDVGSNSPEHWSWGSRDNVPDAVLMLFAKSNQLDAWEQTVKDQVWREGFEQISRLDTTDLGQREPFGFIDGISQPIIDWAQSRKPSPNADQLEYGNVVCVGEFLLGYKNEYGRYTDRPLLDALETGASELPDAEDWPAKKDLGRNGSYVVVRQLEQNVRRFWQFVDEAANSSESTKYEIAEAMVGRKLEDGRSLLALSPDPIPGVGDTGDDAQRRRDTQLNQFTYSLDPEGAQCPLGAHVRRGNPRTPDIPGNPKSIFSHALRILGFGSEDPREDLVASVRFHRLLRRGREYGPALSPTEALQPAPVSDPERGLHFIAIGANIERQFEFVQNAWMVKSKFSGLTEESDPLLGNREPMNRCPVTDAFSIPHEDRIRTRIDALPRFITVRGGAYFFLPGIRALRFLSKLDS